MYYSLKQQAEAILKAEKQDERGQCEAARMTRDFSNARRCMIVENNKKRAKKRGNKL